MKKNQFFHSVWIPRVDNSMIKGYRKFVRDTKMFILPKCITEKILDCSKIQKTRKSFQIGNYQTDVTNELEFGTHVYMNKLHIYAKFNFSISNSKLTKKWPKH